MDAVISSDLLRGHTDTIVLGILRDGDRYGFEIYKTILDRTAEQFELKEATLYSSYKRLEKEGLVTAYWGDETQGARRKYYRITSKGEHRYHQNLNDWRYTKQTIDQLLGEAKS